MMIQRNPFKGMWHSRLGCDLHRRDACATFLRRRILGATMPPVQVVASLPAVIPTNVGIQNAVRTRPKATLDPCVRGDDEAILRSRRGGYSLLEMLVYIAVLAVGINLFVSALGTGSRLAATTTLQLGRIEGIREVQDSFVGYVRRAATVVPGVSRYETGETMVVLHMPPNQPEGFDYLVLGAVRGPERFTVLGLTEKDGVWSEVYMKTLRQPLGQQQYAVDASGIRPLVALTLHVKQEDGERKRSFLVHQTCAVPRGATGGTS